MSTTLVSQNVIMLATADWRAHYQTNKQHMARALAARGFRVLYVESPGLRRPHFNSRRDWKRLVVRLFRGLLLARHVARGIWVLAPLQIPIGHGRPLISWLNSRLFNLQIFLTRFQLGFGQFILWAYHPYTHGMRLNEGLVTSVYHCVDDLAAVPSIDGQAFKVQEAALLGWVDHVFVTHLNLLKKFPDRDKNIHYMPNVVDKQHFRRGQSAVRPEDMPPAGKPVIGFHGALSDFKINFELLADLAAQHRAWNFVIVGDEREGQSNKFWARLQSLPNVFALGYRSYEDLPPYVANFDVALIPFLQNAYTAGMFPMKYYEYIATGVRVVTTPVDFVFTLDHEVLFSDTLSGIEAHIEAALQKGRLTDSEADDIIGENTWDARLSQMLKKMR